MSLPIASGRELLAVIGAYARRHWPRFAWVIASFMMAAASSLLLPSGLGRIVDLVARGGTIQQLWPWAMLMALGVVGAACFGAFGAFGSAVLVERLLAALREDLVADGLRLPRQLLEGAGSGDLVSRASEDVAQASEGLPRTVPAVASSAFSLLLTGIGLAALHPLYALTFAVVFALRWYLRTAPPVYAAERVALGHRAQHVIGSLRGLPAVHAFGLAERQNSRIAEASWDSVRWTMRARAVQNTFFSRLNLAEYLGMAGILVISFLLVGREAVSIGVATTAMLFFLQLFRPMGDLLMVVDELQASAAALGRIVGVGLAVDDSVDPRGDAPHGVAVEVRGLRFAYDDAPPVLHDVDLTIPEGATVALVGSSGAGKSTLAAIVAGALRGDDGTVALSPTARDTMVLITQEVHTFAGTVRENLTLAAPDADDARITVALSAVGAATILRDLPDGLDTQVGAGGHGLTAAQEQLIALARVELAEPALILLDEATAEAGSAHGDQLDRAAGAVLENRSGLVIAHRLDQAAAADEIVVMEEGRVVERGRHADLVLAGGVYARLWAAWEGNHSR